MTPISKLIVAVLVAVLAWVGTATAHRMPEVYVTLEASDLGGEEITAVTLRLHAEDAIKLLQAHDHQAHNLETREEHEALARLAVKSLTLEGGAVSFLGGEVDGNAVLLYLTSAPGLSVTNSAVLSSIYDQWTNHITDLTGAEPLQKVYTQGGALHHHH